MIVWGTRMYGEVDQVPGLFSVRTRFFHLNFLPLVPTSSFLMLGPDRGIELTTVQWRSVLACWGRTALLFVGVFAGIAGAVTFADPTERTAAVIEMAVAASSVAGLVASFRLTRASRERALELCQVAQLPDDMRRRIERHFDCAAGVAVDF